MSYMTCELNYVFINVRQNKNKQGYNYSIASSTKKQDGSPEMSYCYVRISQTLEKNLREKFEEIGEIKEFNDMFSSPLLNAKGWINFYKNNAYITITDVSAPKPTNNGGGNSGNSSNGVDPNVAAEAKKFMENWGKG